jgi:aryl-alcohol dehydrogenase-like predicted oxidoreductase
MRALQTRGFSVFPLGRPKTTHGGRHTLIGMAIQVADFGRTGHKSTRTLFGAAALSRVPQEVADRTLEVLLRHGVNHIDVAASYGDAELRIRPWLKREPGSFFVATKTDARTAKGARDELHRSLDRLGVDHVDLWQLHNLADPIEWDIALSPGGVIEAAVDARAQGLVRFIGVTGHGAQIAANHRRSLERFDFDSVLLPYNYVTMHLPYYAENFEALVKTCAARNVAVQTIKSIALRPWLARGHTRTTWYEPLEAQSDIDLAVWWVLGRPGMFLNTAGDVDLLPLVLDAAERFEKRPGDAEMAALLERTETESLFV